MYAELYYINALFPIFTSLWMPNDFSFTNSSSSSHFSTRRGCHQRRLSRESWGRDKSIWSFSNESWWRQVTTSSTFYARIFWTKRLCSFSLVTFWHWQKDFGKKALLYKNAQIKCWWNQLQDAPSSITRPSRKLWEKSKYSRQFLTTFLSKVTFQCISNCTVVKI